MDADFVSFDSLASSHKRKRMMLRQSLDNANQAELVVLSSGGANVPWMKAQRSSTASIFEMGRAGSGNSTSTELELENEPEPEEKRRGGKGRMNDDEEEEEDEEEPVPSLVRLHNEILAFREYERLTSEEADMRKEIRSEVEAVIQSVFPRAVVTVFGSEQTGLLTRSSDLDMVVLGIGAGAGQNSDDDDDDESSKAEEEEGGGKDKESDLSDSDCLLMIAKALRKAQITSYLEVIQARVPIIKLDHLRSGLGVDICVNNGTGVQAGELICSFKAQYPALEPLAVFLKVFLGQRSLNDTYTGGIGSVILVSMIISFLQHRERLVRRLEALAKRESSSSNSNSSGSGISIGGIGKRVREKSSFPSSPILENLGILLIGFLELYGSKFNLVHTGIALDGNGTYFPKMQRGEAFFESARPSLLTIENPVEADNNMGKSSYMYAKVKRAFEHAHQILSANLTTRNSDSFLSLLVRGPAPPKMEGKGDEGEGVSVEEVVYEEEEYEEEGEDEPYDFTELDRMTSSSPPSTSAKKKRRKHKKHKKDKKEKKKSRNGE